MVEREVKIDDDLEERVGNVLEEIRDNFIDYLKENEDIENFETYRQAQGCDCVTHAADSSTPIYYSQIDGLYYLYGDELDEAYKNAGIGDGTEDNHRQSTIFCYLQEKGHDYIRELTEKFDEALAEDFENGVKNLIAELEEENNG